MAKVLVWHMEFYPYYELSKDVKHDSYFIKEIPDDLIERYIEAQEKFENVHAELSQLIDPED